MGTRFLVAASAAVIVLLAVTPAAAAVTPADSTTIASPGPDTVLGISPGKGDAVYVHSLDHSTLGTSLSKITDDGVEWRVSVGTYSLLEAFFDVRLAAPRAAWVPDRNEVVVVVPGDQSTRMLRYSARGRLLDEAVMTHESLFGGPGLLYGWSVVANGASWALTATAAATQELNGEATVVSEAVVTIGMKPSGIAWTTRLPAGLSPSATDGVGTVFVRAGNRFTAIDAATGTVLDSMPAPSELFAVAPGPGTVTTLAFYVPATGALFGTPTVREADFDRATRRFTGASATLAPLRRHNPVASSTYRSLVYGRSGLMVVGSEENAFVSEDPVPFVDLLSNGTRTTLPITDAVANLTARGTNLWTATYTLDAAGERDVTVTRYDDLPTVSVFAQAATARESGTATVKVLLSQPAGGNVVVNWTTVPGTATAPADFAAASGTVLVKPGNTEAKIKVKLVDDGRGEPDETFTVRLTGLTATVPAVIEVPDAVVTIERG